MGRPKKKPDFISYFYMKELIDNVVKCFGQNYDDRIGEIEGRISLRRIANEYNISILKVRKILITAGRFSTSTSRLVQQYISEGKTIPEITELTGLSRASVHSYLPYSKLIYNMEEISVEAERKKHQRERKRLCRIFVEMIPSMTQDEAEKGLWIILEQLQRCVFVTTEKIRFRYKLCGVELQVDKEADSINKTTIYDAFHKAIELKEVDKNSGGLAANVNPYLYVIFKRIGIIETEEV